MKCSIKRCTAEATKLQLCAQHEQELRLQFAQHEHEAAPPPTLGSLLGSLANGDVPQPDVIRAFVDNTLKARAARVQARQQQAEAPPRPARTPRQTALMVLGFDPHKAVPDAETLKARFRNLAKTYHPDRPAGDAKKMQAINKAYEILTQP